MKNSASKSTQVATLGIFAAIVAVLQLLSYTVKIGTFNLSLVLIPIVISAVIYGPKHAGIIGLVFGAVVSLAAIFGLDGGGYIMFTANPFLTVFLCLFKGAAAGFVSGLAAILGRKKGFACSVILAAVAAPVTNTGVFILFMSAFYKEILYSWSSGTNLVYYVIFSLVGINFIIELLINVILSPIVMRIVPALKRQIGQI